MTAPRTYEDRQRAATEILDSLEGVPVATLRALATGLQLSEDLGPFGYAIDCFADYREFPDIDDPELAVIVLTRALRRADHVALFSKLEGHTEAPWPAVSKALKAELEATR